ncbi:unnamed protein product [Macrosiphum euphorbiae]|uniref:LAGLIDADG homing endonuclease n=1 Tax=Macrosiphum euphorbiae TaxID=13131 RepID=A0AAV0VW20_9HEMI|nr:unnamed protein product [Macrosiphum euphorbiae]
MQSFSNQSGKLTQLTDINETQHIEYFWEVIKNIITKTSEEIIGKQGKTKRKPWFNTVCELKIVKDGGSYVWMCGLKASKQKKSKM